MRARWLWVPAIAGFASLSVPEPAGACSILCLGEVRALTLVEVTLVDGDAAAEIPSWGATGRLEAMPSGEAITLELDGEFVSLDAAGAL